MEFIFPEEDKKLENNSDNLAKYILQSGEKFNRDWGISDPLREGAANLVHGLLGTPNYERDYYKSLLELDDDTLSKKIENEEKFRILRAYPPEQRRKIIEQQTKNIFDDLSDSIAPTPHREPGTTLGNLSYGALQMLPGILGNVALIGSPYGVAGAVGMNTALGNRNASENVYNNLLAKDIPMEEASNRVSDPLYNFADVALRAGTNYATMSALNMPIAVGENVISSPLSQLLKHIADASMSSATGDIALQALTNVRGNTQNTASEYLATGLKSAGMTGLAGLINAAVNWNRLKAEQDKWQFRQPIDVEYTELPPDNPPIGGQPNNPTGPNTPPTAPQGNANVIPYFSNDRLNRINTAITKRGFEPISNLNSLQDSRNAIISALRYWQITPNEVQDMLAEAGIPEKSLALVTRNYVEIAEALRNKDFENVRNEIKENIHVDKFKPEVTKGFHTPTIETSKYNQSNAVKNAENFIKTAKDEELKEYVKQLYPNTAQDIIREGMDRGALLQDLSLQAQKHANRLSDQPRPQVIKENVKSTQNLTPLGELLQKPKLEELLKKPQSNIVSANTTSNIANVVNENTVGQNEPTQRTAPGNIDITLNNPMPKIETLRIVQSQEDKASDVAHIFINNSENGLELSLGNGNVRSNKNIDLQGLIKFFSENNIKPQETRELNRIINEALNNHEQQPQETVQQEQEVQQSSGNFDITLNNPKTLPGIQTLRILRATEDDTSHDSSNLYSSPHYKKGDLRIFINGSEFGTFKDGEFISSAFKDYGLAPFFRENGIKTQELNRVIQDAIDKATTQQSQPVAENKEEQVQPDPLLGKQDNADNKKEFDYIPKEEDGYISSIKINFHGEEHHIDLFADKIKGKDSIKRYGEDYIDIVDSEGNHVAVYTPQTDEFIINGDFGSVGWVRLIEDEFRAKYTELVDKYSSVEKVKSPGGTKPEKQQTIIPLGQTQKPVSKGEEQQAITPITPLGQSGNNNTQIITGKLNSGSDYIDEHLIVATLTDDKELADKYNKSIANFINRVKQDQDEIYRQEAEAIDAHISPAQENSENSSDSVYTRTLETLKKYAVEIGRKDIIPYSLTNMVKPNKNDFDELFRAVNDTYNMPSGFQYEETGKTKVKGAYQEKFKLFMPSGNVYELYFPRHLKTKEAKEGFVKLQAYFSLQKVWDEDNKVVLPKELEVTKETGLENPKEKANPYDIIANRIKSHLIISNDKLENKDLFAIADQTFGGTQGEGKYTVKDAYDAMELGINKAILELRISIDRDYVVGLKNDIDLIDKNILGKIPTQANRTEEQIQLQQFSTPPTLAYIVNWLANIQSGDIVLEPSAGVGGLAVFTSKDISHSEGKRLILNEWSERRANLLKLLFPKSKIYREDAAHIGDILKPKLSEEERPTRVIMNPPFSTSIARAGEHKTENAIAHVEQALQLMKDGGRLVAILGKGMADGTNKFSKWWEHLRKKYNVRAILNIDGSNFKKYGTTFGNIITVIDKTGPTPEGGTVTGVFKDLKDIFEPLKEVRNSTKDVLDLKEEIEKSRKKWEEAEEKRKTPVKIIWRYDFKYRENNDTVFTKVIVSESRDNRDILEIRVRDEFSYPVAEFDIKTDNFNFLRNVGFRFRDVVGYTPKREQLFEKQFRAQLPDILKARGSLGKNEEQGNQKEEQLPQEAETNSSKPIQSNGKIYSASEFKKTFDKIATNGETSLVNIKDLKETLNWPPKVFNNMYNFLAKQWIIMKENGGKIKWGLKLEPNDLARITMDSDGDIIERTKIAGNVYSARVFKEALDQLDEVGDPLDFVKISDLKERLGWPSNVFNSMVDFLEDKWLIEKKKGDVIKWMFEIEPEELDKVVVDNNGQIKNKQGNIVWPKQVESNSEKVKQTPEVQNVPKINKESVSQNLDNNPKTKQSPQVPDTQVQSIEESWQTSKSTQTPPSDTKTTEQVPAIKEPNKAEEEIQKTKENASQNQRQTTARQPQQNPQTTKDSSKHIDNKKQEKKASTVEKTTVNNQETKKRSIDEIVKVKAPYALKVKSKSEFKKEKISDLQKEEEKLHKQEDEGVETPETIRSTYIPTIENGVPHPGKLTEAKVTASIQLPQLTYTPYLPKEMIEEGKISSAQLEAVSYIGQAFTKKISDGSIQGAFLGDGTGLGKGREIAAAIHDALSHGYGNGKAVWISANAKELFREGKVHWADIGNNPDDVFAQNDPKLCPSDGSTIKVDKGILFTAYSTIKYKNKAGEKLRYKQIKEWLGEDYDGIIVLDEAHKANNAIDDDNTSGAGWGKKSASETALTILDLIHSYPNAKILYASATAATEIKNFYAYDRLGLWGSDTAFRNWTEFRGAMEDGGLNNMELLIRELKSAGLYIARSLSFDGVTFENLETPLTPQQIAIYNEIARAWSMTYSNMKKALEVCGDQSGKLRGSAASAFWGANQRCFNQIITYFKIPALIKHIEKQLAENNSIVIQLTNTNEIKKGKNDENDDESLEKDFNISPIQTLINLVKEAYPINVMEAVREGDLIRYKKVLDSEGKPVISSEALAMKNGLIANLETIANIENPIDMIINHFGTNNVAEMTGRSQRIVNGKKQSLSPTTRQKDKADFDNGNKRILIFSEAGSTGVSYHAGKQFKNQQKRIHYILQPGWRADIAFQGMGRTHRSNQAQPPHYVLVTTDVPGEKRFTSSIARRLLQLGALTTGDRKSASQGVFSERDNLEGKQAVEAAHDLLAWLVSTSQTEILDTMGFKDPKSTEKVQITRVFNRILALKIEDQKKVWGKFGEFLDENISAALQKGTLDLGTETVKAENIKVVQKVDIPKRNQNDREAQYIEFELQERVKKRTLDKLEITYTFQSEDGTTTEKKTKIEDYNFYLTKDGEIFAAIKSGNKVITNMQTGENEAKYNIFYPRFDKRRDTTLAILENRGKSQVGKYTKVETLEEAKKLWNEALKRMPVTEPVKLHLIVGSLFPIWEKLPRDHPKIKRVITDDNEEYLGREIPKKELANVLRSLGVNELAEEKLSVKDIRNIFDAKPNSEIIFNNNSVLKVSRVNGEKRFEITNFFFTEVPAYKTKFNAIEEYINFKRRIFLPNNDDILAKFLEEYTIREVKEKNWSDVEQDGIEDINSQIPDDLIDNNYIVHPFFRPRAAYAEDNPYVNKSSKYKFTEEETEERWQNSKTLNKKPLSYVAEFARQLWKGTSDIPALKGEDSLLKAQEFIRQLKQFRRANTEEVTRAFRIILKDLTPDDYDLFERSMVLRDLMETSRIDPKALLPYGYDNQTLVFDYLKIQDEVKKNDNVKKAITDAELYGEKLRNDLIKRAESLSMYDLRDRLKRKHYFRHLVLEYYNTAFGGQPHPTLKNPTRRNYLRQRKGSEKDISSNWILAMGEVYVRMNDDIKIMECLSRLRKDYDKIEKYKEQAYKINFENALSKVMQTLQNITGKDLKEEALNKLNKELLSERAEAISKIFQLAKDGDLPVGALEAFSQISHTLATAGQLENLTDEEREEFARYIGWLVSSEFAIIKKNGEIDYTARRMARRVLKGEAIKRAKLERMLGNEYINWQELIPENYTLWSPSDSTLIFSASSIPENALKIALEEIDEMLGIPLSEVGKVLTSGGNKQIWCIPEKLATALNELGAKKPKGIFGRINTQLMSAFKKWVLLGPEKARVVVYNVRNFFGDLEGVLQGNPSAIKYIPRALRELTDYYYKGTIPTKELAEFVKRGGALTTEFASELQNWADISEFKHLLEDKKDSTLLKMPVKFFKGYMAMTSRFTSYRESILRYASYLSYLDLIQENGGTPPFYAMSKKKEVDAIKDDISAMAFKLQNEELGAYDQISSNMGWLRDNNFVSFGSWLEVNFTRTIQMFRNVLTGNSYLEYYIKKHGEHLISALSNGGGNGAKPPSGNISASTGDNEDPFDLRLSTLAKKSPILAMRILIALAMAFPMYLIVSLFNMMNPSEKNLPPDTQLQTHLTLWTNEQTGDTYFLRGAGAMHDFYDSLPVDQVMLDLKEIANGRQTIRGLISNAISSPINKILGNANPYYKAAAEMIAGVKLYPDFRNPNRIRSNPEYIAQSLNLDWWYKLFTDKPREAALSLSPLVSVAKQNEAAWWYILEKKKEFQRNMLGKSLNSYSETKRGEAARNARTAAIYEDYEKVRKYLREYYQASIESGVKRGDVRKNFEKSLDTMNPLYGLNKREQAQFIKWLGEEDRKYFNKAIRHYRETKWKVLHPSSNNK